MASRPSPKPGGVGSAHAASPAEDSIPLPLASRYRSYAEDSPDCMMMTTGSGKLVAMNTNARTLFGVSSDEVGGLDLEALGAGDLDARFGKVRQVGRARFELLFRRMRGAAFSAVMNMAQVGEDLYQLLLTEISAPRNELGDSERAGRRAGDPFEYAATPLLEVDFSALRLSMDLLRSSGVRDLAAYFSDVPKALADGAALVGVANLNRAFCRLLGIDAKFDYLGRSLSELRALPSEILVESLVCLLEGEEACERELALVGSPQPCVVRARPTLEPGETGGFARALFAFVDISEIGRLREEHERELARSAVLAKELEHRVKNNLNVLSSILDLQAQGMKDEDCANHILAARMRVNSIAMVYQLLSRSATSATLDCRTYIGKLVELFEEAYLLERRNVRIISRLPEELTLDANRAVSIGLIVDELFMNSLRHAFPGNHAGEIRIEMERTETALLVTVGDNGVGVPECFDWRGGEGLGFRLVDALAQQLKASTRFSCERGFAFTFEIALDF
jgi:two-component sensor histidine kinase/PAS domain-containing protein